MKRMILFSAASMFTIIFSSCNSILEKKHEFYYYPSRNVYYDVSNSKYIYSLNGGATWDSLNAKMDKAPATLGAHQVIYSAAPDIWRNNAAHIQQYNGKQITITAFDSNNVNEGLVEERKIKKPKPVAATTSAEPEKKPGFFKRIFGKKN